MFTINITGKVNSILLVLHSYKKLHEGVHSFQRVHQ